jgi:hypothetical protein
MTVAVMKDLEKRGLIYRITSDKAVQETTPGSVVLNRIYASSRESGAHSLLLVSFNKTVIDQLETHTDCEDWLLVGPETKRNMYLVLSVLSGRELAQKAARRTLNAGDFIALTAVFNDCAVSLFTIAKGVPHTVVVDAGGDVSPSIFVGLSDRLPTELIDVSGCCLAVEE